MEIIKINRQNLADINKANQPFDIIGRIKPVFADGSWTYTEEIYGQSYRKEYPGASCGYTDYIDNLDKTVYFAYSGAECIGQIILRRDWNEYVLIEDICVAESARGQGVGTCLIQKAAEWGKCSALKGLALETQDNNLLAYRFYAKCGFVIGAVNTMLYRNFESREYAVFWYLLF